MTKPLEGLKEMPHVGALLTAIEKEVERTMVQARKQQPGMNFSMVFAEGFVRVRDLITSHRKTHEA